MFFDACEDDDVRDHARHGDLGTERRVVHGLRDTVREDALLVGLREACEATAPKV
jgi:hypothetical protein